MTPGHRQSTRVSRWRHPRGRRPATRPRNVAERRGSTGYVNPSRDPSDSAQSHRSGSPAPPSSPVCSAYSRAALGHTSPVARPIRPSPWSRSPSRTVASSSRSPAAGGAALPDQLERVARPGPDLERRDQSSAVATHHECAQQPDCLSILRTRITVRPRTLAAGLVGVPAAGHGRWLLASHRKSLRWVHAWVVDGPRTARALMPRRRYREWLRKGWGTASEHAVDRFDGHRAIDIVRRDHQGGEQRDLDEELLIVQVDVQRVRHTTRLMSTRHLHDLRMPRAGEHKRPMDSIRRTHGDVVIANVDWSCETGQHHGYLVGVLVPASQSRGAVDPYREGVIER
jgi:hypothetical protein